jgi:hypothetical protein
MGLPGQRARGSESAFGELVARHIDFVHSTALWVVNGHSHLAQDVAQTVFINPFQPPGVWGACCWGELAFKRGRFLR